MTPSLDTPAHVVRKQTVTLEIDLIAVGEQDAEAVEIRVNGKAYDVRGLADALGRSSWHYADSVAAANFVEQVALWAAKPGDWEVES